MADSIDGSRAAPERTGAPIQQQGGQVPAERIGAATLQDWPSPLRSAGTALPAQASPASVGSATELRQAASPLPPLEPGEMTEADSAATKAAGGILGLDFRGLWQGSWDEIVDEDLDVVGNAYEAGVMGGVLAEEDSYDMPFTDPAAQAPVTPRGPSAEAQAKNRISVTSFISNFVLSIIGSTTLGLARQTKVAGVILAPLMVFFGYVIVSENTWLLCVTIDKLQSQSKVRITAYPDFAKAAFGVWGKRVASVTSICALVGMTCTGLVMEAQNLNYVFPISWPWGHCSHCGQKWWAFFLTPLCLVYCFVDAARLLKKSAFLGPLVCILTVLFAWIGSGNSIAGAQDFPEGCDIDRRVLPPPTDFFHIGYLLQLSQVGSYGFYSFAVIVTVPSLRSQMKRKGKAAAAAITAYSICLVMFTPIMFLAVAGFGEFVPENLVDGMRTDRPTGWWALNRPFETGHIMGTGVALDFVVTLNLMLTEAIYIPCTIMAIEASFPDTFRKGPPWTRVALRIGYTSFRLLVATTFNSFVAMSALVSSLFCVCNNIIFPILAFHWVGAAEVSTLRKGTHVLVLVYGLFIMLLGTYSAAAALSQHKIEEPGSGMREGISPECVAAFHRINGSVIGV